MSALRTRVGRLRQRYLPKARAIPEDPKIVAARARILGEIKAKVDHALDLHLDALRSGRSHPGS